MDRIDNTQPLPDSLPELERLKSNLEVRIGELFSGEPEEIQVAQERWNAVCDKIRQLKMLTVESRVADAALGKSVPPSKLDVQLQQIASQNQAKESPDQTQYRILLKLLESTEEECVAITKKYHNSAGPIATTLREAGITPSSNDLLREIGQRATELYVESRKSAALDFAVLKEIAKVDRASSVKVMERVISIYTAGKRLSTKLKMRLFPKKFSGEVTKTFTEDCQGLGKASTAKGSLGGKDTYISVTGADKDSIRDSIIANPTDFMLGDFEGLLEGTDSVFASLLRCGKNHDYLTYTSTGDQVGILLFPEGKVELLTEASEVHRALPKGTTVLQSSRAILETLGTDSFGNPNVSILKTELSDLVAKKTCQVVANRIGTERDLAISVVTPQIELSELEIAFQEINKTTETSSDSVIIASGTFGSAEVTTSTNEGMYRAITTEEGMQNIATIITGETVDYLTYNSPGDVQMILIRPDGTPEHLLADANDKEIPHGSLLLQISSEVAKTFEYSIDHFTNVVMDAGLSLNNPRPEPKFPVTATEAKNRLMLFLSLTNAFFESEGYLPIADASVAVIMTTHRRIILENAA